VQVDANPVEKASNALFTANWQARVKKAYYDQERQQRILEYTNSCEDWRSEYHSVSAGTAAQSGIEHRSGYRELQHLRS
jgi:hypothetical protein